MPKRYGLIFDIDGVIADSESINAIATAKVFAELFATTGVKPEDFTAGLGRGAEEYILAAAKIHQLELSQNQLAEAVKARQENFFTLLKEKQLPAFPGVITLIKAADACPEFSLAIATSSARKKSEAVLTSAKIPFQKFFYLTGDEVANKKPDPELFRKASEGIAISPKDCVVIEDAPNGITAAKAAGCKCIGVTNSTVKENLSAADLIVDSLTEINLGSLRELLNC